MIHNLKPYPAYKDSGVPWLGKVPAHWEVRRVKTLCTMESGDGITAISIDPVGAYPVYGGNGMRGYTSNYTHDGNFVLIGRQGALCGNVHIVRGRFWASEHAVVATAHSGYSPGWLGAILGVMNLNQYSIAAAQPGLSVERVLNLQLPVPPFPEQTAIVRFLDHADRRIRRYIRAKQKLSALLEEQKQAIIHQAVTGQIDVRTGQPYPAYKPSGLEWLGEVPEHWEVTRTKFLFKEVDIRSTTGKETHLSMSQVLGLVPSHIVERTLTSNSYIGGKLCEEGDLVLNRLKAHLGVFAIAKQAGVISPDYSVFRKRGSKDMEYYEKVCQLPALRTELRIRTKGIVEGFWRLYTEDLFDIRLPVPSFLEQCAIAKYVAETTLNINGSISRARRQIDLLHEYRTRLIADVVTGKLDVREAAVALPEVDPRAVEDELGDTHAAPEVLPGG